MDEVDPSTGPGCPRGLLAEQIARTPVLHIVRRDQLKWIALAAAVWIPLLVLNSVARDVLVVRIAMVSGVGAFVLALGAGVLRYRLYDLDVVGRLLDGIGPRRVPVLLTVRPLRDFDEAEYLRHEVPDVHVPESYLDRLGNAGD